MAPRIRMAIVADDEALADVTVAAPPAPTEPIAAATNRFHALMVIEGIPTGDARTFVENSLTWRTLPLPLMATDRTTEWHLDSVLIGNFDTIERRGAEIHGWGDYIADPGEEAARLIGLVQSGELRGFSVDADSIEFEVLFPTTLPGGEPLPGDPMMALLTGEEVAPIEQETGEDGTVYDVVPMPMPIERVTEGRLMGGTVVPFPAFQEAFIENSDEPALAAAASSVFVAHGVSGAMLTATCARPRARVAGGAVVRERVEPRRDGPREGNPSRFSFPTIPPRAWFDVEEPPGPMPFTILDSGQAFGHLAVWGECHVGIANDCVMAPASSCNYARFHVGECPVDDGGRVSAGVLTYRTGHAPLEFGGSETKAHYDNSGTGAVDVVALDGEHGIWLCGAARSTLSDADVREVMMTPPSGDWRGFGGRLELVAALCVNTPGFNTVRARARKENGMVASLVLCNPPPPLIASSGGLDEDIARRAIRRIAASVGRSPEQRVAALTSRVHGGGR